MEGTRQRVFVGDVQGCSNELRDLLERLGYDPAMHDLWFTGDLVNRGPDSLGVLRLVRELGGNTVLGNHDLHLLRVAAGERTTGRKDTFQDVLTAPDRGPLLEWLRERPLAQGWDDAVLVHAGVCPGWGDPVAVAGPLEQGIRAGRIPWDNPDLRFLLQARHCNASGERPADDEHPPARFHPWDHFYRGRRTVVFGHWAARGRVRGKRVRGLDTGCVWGGSLTAWIAEEDRFVAVPARRTYQVPQGK
ncbi:MAG: metallophosphoesterase [Deferrisomatales bacterium]|nr:metallophosphoesterase [Deferrisomatales bacterium]